MASPCLKESGILNSAQIGIIGGLFSIIYAIGRLINGVLSDIKSPSCIICIGLFGVGISLSDLSVDCYILRFFVFSEKMNIAFRFSLLS